MIHFYNILQQYNNGKFGIIAKEAFNIRKNELLMNEDIRDKEIRLIDSDGSMLGVVLTIDAQKLADSKNLDLVKIVPNAVPPVCKIIDYGKSVFEQAKKEKEAKKNQKVVALKEVRLSATIEDHDFEFKVKNAYKFLQDGDKVKASIRFRGREMRYTVAGKEVLAKFAEAVKDVGIVDRIPKLEGKSMTMIMNPKKP
ncbi:MAG TPA: translation initiation factor IF-3 [Ruminiclostridium sp.]